MVVNICCSCSAQSRSPSCRLKARSSSTRPGGHHTPAGIPVLTSSLAWMSGIHHGWTSRHINSMNGLDSRRIHS